MGLDVDILGFDAFQFQHVLFPHINAALDSLLNPLRLIATLHD